MKSLRVKFEFWSTFIGLFEDELGWKVVRGSAETSLRVAFFGNELRVAEIDDSDLALLVDHNVLQLDIFVQDPAHVAELDTFGHFQDDLAFDFVLHVRWSGKLRKGKGFVPGSPSS